MELISLREYARRRGVSLAAVQKSIKSGRISTVEGKIDPAVADIQWEQNTNPHQSRRRMQGRVARPAALSSPHLGPQPMPGGDLADVRARRESALAELAELDLAQRRGELVPTADVERALSSKIIGMRDALDSLADRLAPLLAAEADQAKVYATLREEVRRALQLLSLPDARD